MASQEFSTPPRPPTDSSSHLSTSASRPQTALRSGIILPSTNANSATTTTSAEILASPSSSKFRRKQHSQPTTRFLFGRQIIRRRTLRWIMLSLWVTLAICLYRTLPSRRALDLLADNLVAEDIEVHGVLEPTTDVTPKSRSKLSPEEWIRLHSHIHHNKKPPTFQHPILAASKPRAVLISLVRSSELPGILQSMRQLESHFNAHPAHRYPWIFFSETPFTQSFINATTHATSARTQYELIPRSHWTVPSWIDTDRFMSSLDYLGALGVGKGHMVSYRHMCRWNSGFFYKHPALAVYDYYWRVEPDVHFFCAIPYDPFRLFEEYGFVYGFNMAILEDARSFPSLWPATLRFIADHPELVHPEADVSWLLDGDGAGGGYNNCQFFSNFEIGDLNFFRGNDSKRSGEWGKMGRANERYFDFLDRLGGFFYERFGDAPIHTLSVSLFAPRGKVWYFRDVGYQHDIARHCPKESAGRCACEPTRLDENFYKLVPMESPQRKPMDTCLRMWLEGSGGKGDGHGKREGGWLEKKKGWEREAEVALGGDGFGGYVKEG